MKDGGLLRSVEGDGTSGARRAEISQSFANPAEHDEEWDARRASRIFRPREMSGKVLPDMFPFPSLSQDFPYWENLHGAQTGIPRGGKGVGKSMDMFPFLGIFFSFWQSCAFPFAFHTVRVSGQ